MGAKRRTKRLFPQRLAKLRGTELCEGLLKQFDLRPDTNMKRVPSSWAAALSIVEEIEARYRVDRLPESITVEHALAINHVLLQLQSISLSKRGRVLLPKELDVHEYGTMLQTILRRARFPTPEEHAELRLAAEAASNDPRTFLTAKQVEIVQDAYARLSYIGRPDAIVDFVLMMQRMEPSGTPRVRVGPSKTHSDSVFATTTILPGQFVTGYRVDYISIACTNSTAWYALSDVDLPLTELDGRLISLYSSAVSTTSPFHISTDAAAPVDPLACGHLIDDYACLPSDFTLDELEHYTRTSVDAQNCIISSVAGVGVFAVATKEIQKGRQLFTSFGANYYAANATAAAATRTATSVPRAASA